MSKVDYKQSYAWKEAIKLAKDVFSLIETLPDAAQPLAQHLAMLATQIPAELAECLIERQPAKLGSVLALDSAVEIIDSIYPALDTGDVKTGTEQLLERLQSSRLTELVAPTIEDEPQDENEELESDDNDDDAEDHEEESDEHEDEEEAASTSVSVSEE